MKNWRALAAKLCGWPRPVCDYPKVRLSIGGHLSTYCYWHYASRMSLDNQVRLAERRFREATALGTAKPKRSEWPEGERWCGGCLSLVPLWYCRGARCKACATRGTRAARDLKTYGATPETIAELMTLQEGACGICENFQVDRALARDHDHGTDTLRGLLCKSCNHDLLGAAHDSVRLLLSAIYYLENPPMSGRWKPSRFRP